MVFRSEQEQDIAMEIERVKHHILEKEGCGLTARNESQKLELLRHLYAEIVWNHPPKGIEHDSV